jgi:two-component system, sensor histidine kinase and response regulator
MTIMDEKNSGILTHSLESLPEIDLQSALNRILGNRQLLVDLLVEFCRKYIGFCNEVRNALAVQDMDLARNLVHTFKGSSGTLSLDTIYRSAADLEDALANKDIFPIEAKLGRIEQALCSLFEAINQLSVDQLGGDMPAGGMVSGDSLGQAQFNRLLGNLSDSLVRHNLKAAHQFQQLKAVIGENDYPGTLLEIETNIKNLNFAMAKTRLDELAASLGIELY